MKSVWVFQDLTEGVIRIFAREDNAKEFALDYFVETFQKYWDEDYGLFEPEVERFKENWCADEGLMRLDEVEVE